MVHKILDLVNLVWGDGAEVDAFGEMLVEEDRWYFRSYHAGMGSRDQRNIFVFPTSVPVAGSR